MNRYDIAIIGAGPAGIMAAIIASQNKKNVALIERNPQIGRKLLATGNGRCNLTNKYINVERYHGSNLKFIETVLNTFDQPKTINFFRDLGLLVKEEDNGRIFPITNQASSVVELLKHSLFQNNVSIHLNSIVVKIEKSGHWKISLNSGDILEADKLIISTGGKAAHQMGSTGDGFHFAQKLGHTLTPYYAALVPIETIEQWPKEAQGIKLNAKTWATSDNKQISESSGDILFTAYGVSGPAVMSQAGIIAPYLKMFNVMLHIDLFPDISDEQLEEIFNHIIENDNGKTIEDILIGLLPDGLIPIIINISGVEKKLIAAKVSIDKLQNIIKTMKDLALTISKLRPFKEAQVTAGGVNTEEIDPNSLESKLVKDLYFAGEILDAYGDSGGFNLQWAWSSGYIAGKC